MTLRVLLVLDQLVKYTTGLARGLSDLGCDVRMLGRDHDFEFGGRPGALRAHVERELRDVGWEGLPGRVRDPRGLPDVVRAHRRMARFGPDVVHLQETVIDDVRLLAAAAPPAGRFALTVHDPSPHPGDNVRSPWKRSLRSALIHRAGLVFVHADALRDELVTLERPAGPVVVVPHVVGSAERAPLPARPSVLFFGRLSAYKGLDVLLDAMPLVWQSVPSAGLTVAGAGPLPAHPVLADARVTTRHEHIPEDQVARLFAEATCVALPYRQASQSGVGSQAKAYGRGMVVTAVGGLPELVDERTGRVVAPEDPRALAAALVEVLSTPGLATAMGDAAAASGSEASFTRVAELTLEAYRVHLGA